LKKLFRKYVPDPGSVRSGRLAATLGDWLHHHPNLWYLNRRSVPGAVAIGLFAGLIPGPVQMGAALLLAIALKKNIPVAMVVTWYTNPLTIVPLYVLAYEYGRLLTGELRHGAATPGLDLDGSDWMGSFWSLYDWMLAAGKPLAIGLVALAFTLAIVGYFLTRFGWRLYVILAWRARKRRREGRA
jgi:uncharacterized protein (DUF2062 family)